MKLLKRVGFEVEIYDSQWNNKFLVAVIFLGKPMLRKYVRNWAYLLERTVVL